MTYAECFAGIGGWSLGLQACGWELKWQCECDPWCRRLLKERFGVPIYDDIRTICGENPERVDVLCGSPPCQPFSINGRLAGEADDRNLWPATLELVRFIGPDWFLCENVSNVANMVLSRWQDDLEAIGYKSIPFDVPSCAVGLQTMERHIWLIASRERVGLEGDAKAGISRQSQGKPAKRQRGQDGDGAPVIIRGRNLPKPHVCRSRKGFPYFVDRIRSLGNAVPPQIPYLIGQAINQIENQQ